jgi:hypothetical protein
LIAGEIVVFAGPSLHGAGPAPQGCVLWPPAARGDVLRALAREPRALVVLDGYFHRVPAVTHQELLYALDAGVPVIGAASMGALRAAELARYGMRGVGRVYADYRDGRLDGDDEVALLHAPAEYGYAPIGVALVEVRAALAALVDAGRVTAERAAHLVASLKALAFTERSPERVAREAARHLGAATSAFEVALASTHVKRDDACLALESAVATAGDLGAGTERAAGVARRESANVEASARLRAPTGYLTCFKEISLPAPGVATDETTVVTLLQAASVAFVLHAEAVRFVRCARRQAILAAAAEGAGVEPDAASLRARTQALAAALPRRRGLPHAEIEAQARRELLAAHPAARRGLDALARRFGCAGDGDEALLAVATAQPDLVPAWELARAFAWSPALAAAIETARAALAHLDAWRNAHADGRVERGALLRLGGRLWSSALEHVGARGAERGLFPAAGLADGLFEALERVAPAEARGEAAADYRAARARLLAADLGGGCLASASQRA